MPVVHVPFGAIGALFADLGSARLGWLLADHAERLPARESRAVLGRISSAVFAGDTAAVGKPAPAATAAITTTGAITTESVQRLAERTARYGTWLRSGRTERQRGSAGSAGEICGGRAADLGRHAASSGPRPRPDDDRPAQ